MDLTALHARKARLVANIADCEARAERHRMVGPGYGNPTWANHFADRADVLKQRLYELNLVIAEAEGK